ncbi:MAG TPA: hypothetical protein VE650_21690 [Acetobacteraceae bacterium]|nr:hypothetical protein [Acetobacteraceae bacterium]
MVASLRRIGRRAAGWLLLSVWVMLPLLPLLGLLLSRLLGVDEF